MAMKDQPLGDRLAGNLLRPVLIAAMVACLAAPVIMILEQIMTGWNGEYLLVFAFLAAMESILSERLLQRRQIKGGVYLTARGVELLILLAVLKAVNDAPLGLDQLWAGAPTWTIDLEGFITPVDLLTGILLVSLWLGALFVARQDCELDLVPQKAKPPADKTSPEYYLWMTQPPPVRDRELALARLGEAFVWGGIAILISSALLNFMHPGGWTAVPVLLYFALGVAVLSQARFSVAYTGWQAQGLSIQRNLSRRWLGWAVVFLAGVALASLLLPTGYSMGPVLALCSILGLLAQAFTLIVALGSYLVALLLSWLLPSSVPPPVPPLEPVPAQQAGPPDGAVLYPWPEAIGSAIFWAVLTIIVVYALVRLARDRFGPQGAEVEAGDSWWIHFWQWLQDLWRRWLAWEQDLRLRPGGRAAQGGDRRQAGTRLSRIPFLGRLPPREMIRYFYLSAARRAAAAGRPRATHQSPYEYQADLAHHFPDVEPDLTGLTEAFVHARYSQKPLNNENVDEVKPLWQRVKSALRRRRTRAQNRK